MCTPAHQAYIYGHPTHPGWVLGQNHTLGNHPSSDLVTSLDWPWWVAWGLAVARARWTERGAKNPPKEWSFLGVDRAGGRSQPALSRLLLWARVPGWGKNLKRQPPRGQRLRSKLLGRSSWGCTFIATGIQEPVPDTSQLPFSQHHSLSPLLLKPQSGFSWSLHAAVPLLPCLFFFPLPATSLLSPYYHILPPVFHKDLAASCLSRMDGCVVVPGGQLGGWAQRVGQKIDKVQGAARWPAG